jgi:hypothetical protein
LGNATAFGNSAALNNHFRPDMKTVVPHTPLPMSNEREDPQLRNR